MRLIELRLAPELAELPDQVRSLAARQLGWPSEAISVVPVRRSVDARRGPPQVVLTAEVYRGAPPPPQPAVLEGLRRAQGEPILIVGSGPAGYFAALELLFAGCRPVVLEQGKDTRARRYDLRAIMQEGRVDPRSNYCFGEGGAGTYSDGKLYTRASKRGDVERVLRLLVEHGANPSILIDTHPHIGSNKLPGVVERLRASILAYGGEVHFQTQVTDLWVEGDRLRGVRVGSEKLAGQAVILATGHSARDIHGMLLGHGLALESKPFAVGLRVEHPQELIDEIQYRQRPRHPALPAASYRLACQAGGRGVYSFCMCPGGLIVPASTAPGEVVVNGMSMSSRNSRFANSGLVVEVGEADLDASQGVLAGVALQRQLEERAFQWGGGQTQRAPAQRLEDFLCQRGSASLPACSYVPGLAPAPLHELLPSALGQSLRAGVEEFGRKLRGYRTQEAVLVAIESRTSSPVRIPREEGLHHPQLDNLYPCGEGAGYAGGIVSAALDGQKVAAAIAARVAR